MSRRRALLIGVEGYPRADYRALPCVPADLDRMEAALTANGYAVTRCEGTGQNPIRDAIDDTCRAAEPGETLVIYFTGHGQSVGNRPYLVPGDVRGRGTIQRFVDADISEAARDSDAALIVLLVDACRDPHEAKGMAGWNKPPQHPEGPAWVTLFGCAHNQFCQYAGDAPFSLFTAALAETLAPDDNARTIAEVVAAAQRRLDALTDAHGKDRQAITPWGDAALTHVICDSPKDRAMRELDDPWLVAALGCALWDTVGDADAVQAARDALRTQIEICREFYDEAIAAVGPDPWRDAGLPERIITALEALLLDTRTAVRLDAAELSAALLAPFAREAALATAARRMAPDDFEHHPTPSAPRAAFQESLTLHPRLERQGKRLQTRDAPADARAVGLLVAYRAAARAAGTWRAIPEGWLPGPLFAALGATDNQRARQLRLVRCLGQSPSADLDAEAGGLRPKLIGALLSVAAALAVDARRLTDVLIDHVGLSDPVDLEAFVARLSALTWDRSGVVWSAALTCIHPAEGAAVEAHVEATQELLDHIRVTLLADMGADDAKWLPARVDARGVQPEETADGPAYRTPHVRFHLDPARVRELLMGTELYGEPALAIRELYQNALDACRYRERRRDYLVKTRGPGPDTEWAGEIAFEEGEDERGRYIDCIDNGVGMTWELLTQCYACAGRRFAETPEFIDEHADWLRVDEGLRLHPNSQFGIGVLSVFMLAEEVHVTTRRYERDGTLGEVLYVRIAGSGSLFRVVEPCPVEMPDAGTRVRLYLARELTYEFERVSLEELLNKLVWRPYYPLRVGAKLPRPAGDLRCAWWHGGVVEQALQDIWWVRGTPPQETRGAALYDGVVVDREWRWPIVVDFDSSSDIRLRTDRRGFEGNVGLVLAQRLVAAGLPSLAATQPIPAGVIRLIRTFLDITTGRQLEQALIARAVDVNTDRGELVNAAEWGMNSPNESVPWLNGAFICRPEGLQLGLTLDELGPGLTSIPTTNLSLIWAGLTAAPRQTNSSLETWLQVTQPAPPQDLGDLERLADESPPAVAPTLQHAVRAYGPCRVFDLVALAYRTGRDLLQAWERARSLAPLGVVVPPAEALAAAPRWYRVAALASPRGEPVEARCRAEQTRARAMGLDVPEIHIAPTLVKLPLDDLLSYLAHLNPRPREIVQLSTTRLLEQLKPYHGYPAFTDAILAAARALEPYGLQLTD